MTYTYRDQNHIPTMLAVLQTDGATLKPVQINPANFSLKVDDDTTGTDQGPAIADEDENFVPTLMAVSSVDGVTPVVLYTDINSKLLIDSN